MRAAGVILVQSRAEAVQAFEASEGSHNERRARDVTLMLKPGVAGAVEETKTGRRL